jgi:chromosome segregation ATPase
MIASGDIAHISARWKLHNAASDSTAKRFASPAPDLRDRFLQLRAEVLRRDHLISQVPSIDDELANTLLALRECERVRDSQKVIIDDLRAELDRACSERSVLQSDVSHLSAELLELKKQLADAKDKTVLATATAFVSIPQPGASKPVLRRQSPVQCTRPTRSPQRSKITLQ